MAIRIKGLDFNYASKRILKEINLHVRKGEFIGIVGPNGSGKSTLLKNISKLLEPSKGAVLIEGKNVLKLKTKELARRLAALSENQTINFEFTVQEVVLMGRNPHLEIFEREKPHDFKIVEQSMKATNVWQLRDCFIGQISAGERQRVFIAQALAQQPTILLLDEPTVHLDINQKLEIFNLIYELNKKRQITIITVLHDLNHASQYCDKLVLLNKGKIFAAGKPNEVITPSNIETVYGVRVLIKQDEITGKPLIIHLRNKEKKTKGRRLHIVGGGGNALSLMNYLIQEGFELSCGVLNSNDGDCIAAKMLGIEVIEEKPFSAISTHNFKKNLKMIKQADAVILANIPFGKGNIANMCAMVEASKHGIPVILIERQNIEKRDYTNGRATTLYSLLKSNSARVIEDFTEIGKVLEELKTEKQKEVNLHKKGLNKKISEINP